MPIEKFDTESFDVAQDRLLEYVNVVADAVAPDFVFCAGCDPLPVESQAPWIFRRRYNSGKLNTAFSYEDYIRYEDEESTISIIRGLGVDEEKFWYLLLFVSDYVVGSTYDTLKIIDSPVREVERLVEIVKANEEGFSSLYGMRHRKDMTLSIKTKGRILEISSPDTISLIAALCKDGLRELPAGSIFERGRAEAGCTKSESVSLWLFAKLLMLFFDKYPQFKNKRKRRSGPTCSIVFLISKLAFITRLTTNTDYYLSSENIKAIMRQYRDYELDTTNSIYG